MFVVDGKQMMVRAQEHCEKVEARCAWTADKMQVGC